MGRMVFLGGRVFTGDEFLDGHAILVEAGVITAVIPETEVPTDA